MTRPYINDFNEVNIIYFWPMNTGIPLKLKKFKSIIKIFIVLSINTTY